MENKKHIHQRGFTLIELLVVIAIIAMLAGILFPAVNRGLETARRNQAAADVRSIASAITLFYNEYGYFPVPFDSQGGAADLTDISEEGVQNIIQVLTAVDAGANADHALNPRRKVFLEMKNFNEEGIFNDPWGNEYRILLDTNFDNIITWGGGDDETNHRTRVIVYSTGDGVRDISNVR